MSDDIQDRISKIILAAFVGPCLYAGSLYLGSILFPEKDDSKFVAELNQEIAHKLPGYHVVTYKKSLYKPCGMLDNWNVIVAAKEDKHGEIIEELISIGVACVDAGGTVRTVYFDK